MCRSRAWISASRLHEQREAGENTMKKLLLGTLALVAMAAPAVAADMAVKAAPPPVYVAPIYNWGGFYLGGNGGYGWSNQCINITAINLLGVGDNEGCRSAGGGVIGGQLGYRWQAHRSGYSDLRPRGTGPISVLRAPASSCSRGYLDFQNRWIGSLHGSGWLRMECNPALCEGRRRGRRPELLS